MRVNNMKQITENLYFIAAKGFMWVPIFIIVDENENLTLVDTGLKKHAKLAMRSIREKWGPLDKIKRIIFTHRHYDHTGGLELLIDEVRKFHPEHKIEIVMHEDEASHYAKDIKRKDLQPNRLIKHDEYIDQQTNERCAPDSERKRGGPYDKKNAYRVFSRTSQIRDDHNDCFGPAGALTISKNKHRYRPGKHVAGR